MNEREHLARIRYACFLGKLAVALAFAWLVLVALTGCTTTPTPPPPSCDLSANPEICKLQRRIDQLESDAAYRRACVFIHGADSIICQ